jgi:ParB/RepB/Spo0J family partition protein
MPDDPDMDDTQLDLLPAKPPRAVSRMLALDDLPDDEHLPPGEPDADMLHSVAEWGVLVPILVSNATYEVKDGIRRVRAARRAGHKSIPARVLTFEDDYTAGLSVTLVSNNQRSENPAAELVAVEGLLERGLTEQQLATTLRIPIARIRKLLGLRTLHPDLRSAFLDGDLAATVAFAAAKLPPGAQENLLSAEKVTGHAVREARSVGVGKARGAVLDGVIAATPPTDWREPVAALLTQVLDRIPDSETSVRGRLARIVKDIAPKP